MKIYTRTGDSGETSLYDGTRVAKSDVTINLLGDIDELNAHLGLLHSQAEDTLALSILEIMNNLFRLSANIAGANSFKDFKLNTVIDKMEQLIDQLDTEIPPLTNFIYPIGGVEVSSIHIARAVCRRVERRLVEFNEIQLVESSYIKYINRLSDFLFVFARYTTYKLKRVEHVVIF